MSRFYIGFSTLVLFSSLCLNAAFICPNCGVEKYYYVHNSDAYPGMSCVSYCDLCGHGYQLSEGHVTGCPELSSLVCPESSSCQPYSCLSCENVFCRATGEGHNNNHILYSLTVTSPCGVEFNYLSCETADSPSYSSNEAAISAKYGSDYNVCHNITCDKCNYTRCIKHKDDDHATCPGACAAGTSGCTGGYGGEYSHDTGDFCTFVCSICHKSRTLTGSHIPGCPGSDNSENDDDDNNGGDDSGDGGGDSGGSDSGDTSEDELPEMPVIGVEYQQGVISSGYDDGHGTISDHDIQDRLNMPYSGTTTGGVPDGVAPEFTIPLGVVSGGHLQDIVVDFDSPVLSTIINFFRMFECGVLIALSILALNKILSSFEH